MGSSAGNRIESGSATVTIACSAEQVFDAIADVTRMGEWSGECTGGRWVDGATGPALGARFEGDNIVALAGLTLKRWTTTSEVTACAPGAVFEFVAEAYTTWRYEMAPTGPDGATTVVTESFRYEATGLMGFVYGTVLRRSRSMEKGMHQTLGRLRQSLESTAG